MSRRGKTSPAEDLIAVAARLPWWACVALAVVSYLGLHAVATRPLAVSADPGQLQGVIVGTYLRALAMAGQYILPIVFVAGAIMSALGRRARRDLVTGVVSSRAAGALDGMNWQQFELLVGEGFRLQGYTVVETGGGGADGGVDLVLRRGGEKFLVQCKQWKAHKVGVDVVRQLYGVMAATGAAGGFVVTSGTFTAEALRFADGRNVKLLDGSKLLALLKQARAARAEPKSKPGRTAVPSPAHPSPDGESPACPKCARPMVRRMAQRGPTTGREFWGCASFPACKETRPIG